MISLSTRCLMVGPRQFFRKQKTQRVLMWDVSGDEAPQTRIMRRMRLLEVGHSPMCCLTRRATHQRYDSINKPCLVNNANSSTSKFTLLWGKAVHPDNRKFSVMNEVVVPRGRHLRLDTVRGSCKMSYGSGMVGIGMQDDSGRGTELARQVIVESMTNRKRRCRRMEYERHSLNGPAT